MTRNRIYVAAVLLAALAAAWGMPRAIAADNAPAAAEVNIDNFSFSPATITVKAGTAVTWTNRDDIPHTVVADDKSFKSSARHGDKFTFTATKPGTYSYLLRPSQDDGKLIVGR